MSGEAQQKIELYLGRLRQRLRGMNDEDAGLFIKNFETYAAGVSAEVKASAPKA